MTLKSFTDLDQKAKPHYLITAPLYLFSRSIFWLTTLTFTKNPLNSHIDQRTILKYFSDQDLSISTHRNPHPTSAPPPNPYKPKKEVECYQFHWFLLFCLPWSNPHFVRITTVKPHLFIHFKALLKTQEPHFHITHHAHL